MKKVLKHLRSVSEKVTVELKAEQFSYKAMVFVEGSIVYTIEGKSWKKLKKFLMNDEVREMIEYRIHYDGQMRDKGFNELLKSLYDK